MEVLNAAASFPYLAAIPIVTAIFGAASVAQLGRAIVARNGSSFSSAEVSEKPTPTRGSVVACLDLLALTAVIWMVVLSLKDGATRPEVAMLAFATVFQAAIALIAFKLSRDIGLDKPVNGSISGEQYSRRNITGGRDVSSATAEKPPMPRSTSLSRDERARFVELGIQRYQAMRPEIERSHAGEYVAISVKTGKFTTTKDDAKLKAFADSLGADDFLWMTRVGSH